MFSRQQPKPAPVPYGAGMGPSYIAPDINAPRQWAPAWNNFAANYRQDVANQPLMPIEEVQSENAHYFTHPDAKAPTVNYARWNNSTLSNSWRNEQQHGSGGIPEVQTSAGRAPDPRWSPVPVGRIMRTPQDYSFLRPFDVEMGVRNFNGTHYSMADHKRMNQPQVYGFTPTPSARNTYRVAPPPMDVNIVDLPPYGTTPPVVQAEFTSPASVPSRQGYRL